MTGGSGVRRDQLGFRSYYFPVKDVIDGDLCETFTSLDPARQVPPHPPATPRHAPACAPLPAPRVRAARALPSLRCRRGSLRRRRGAAPADSGPLGRPCGARRRQAEIAQELERTPGEVAKKLEDMRIRLL